MFRPRTLTGPLLVLAFCVVFARKVSAQSHIVWQPYYESLVDSDRLTLRWQTDTSMLGAIRYGETPSYELGELREAVGHDHEITITGLQPSRFYYVELRGYAGSRLDSAGSTPIVCETASDFRSTGAVRVYFNRGIDSTTYPFLPRPSADADFLQVLKDRIDSAKHSIDVALYSFSGISGARVADWLIAARARGVDVRFIADSGAIKGSTDYTHLLNGGVPAITNAFGANRKLWSNIHHNKFFVFDGRGDYGSKAWVLTGSWNVTDQQTTTDYQNIVLVQDEALAKAYEAEFEEEWGSSTDLPDPLNSRFSTRKTSNTPRSFRIGGHEAHLFFSPTDSAGAAVSYFLSEARSQVLFAEYDVTKQSITASLIDAMQRGVGVHGVIDQGSQLGVLQSAGADVLQFTQDHSFDTLLHHKYCLVDPGTPSASLLTGSLNWSQSADVANNENLLVLRSQDVVDRYVDEWIARYYENGGHENIVIPGASVEQIAGPDLVIEPSARGLTLESARSGRAQLDVVDLTGRVVLRESVELQAGERRIFAFDLPTGCYLARLSQGQMSSATRFVISH